jgi:hypothetical protein
MAPLPAIREELLLSETKQQAAVWFGHWMRTQRSPHEPMHARIP